MGVRYPTAFSRTSLANPGGGPSNTIIATTPQIAQAIDGQIFLIFWSLGYLSGGTGPVVAYDIRRGTATTDTLLTGNSTCTELGGVRIQRGGCVVDLNPGVGTPQYSLGFNMTNAGSGCTITEVCLVVLGL